MLLSSASARWGGRRRGGFSREGSPFALHSATRQLIYRKARVSWLATSWTLKLREWQPKARGKSSYRWDFPMQAFSG